MWLSERKNSALVIELATNLNKSRINEVFSIYTSCEIDQCSCSKPLFDVFDIQKPDGILFDILESQKRFSYFIERNAIGS